MRFYITRIINNKKILHIIILIFILLFTYNLFSQPNNKIESSDSSTRNMSNEKDGENILNESSSPNTTDISIESSAENTGENAADSLSDKKNLLQKTSINSESGEKGNVNEESTLAPANIITEQKEQSQTGKKNFEEEKKVINKQDNIQRKPVIKNDGLIEIKDGDFKYSRIPGISVKKEIPEEKDEDIAEIDISPVVQESLTKDKNKSITEPEKNTSDTVVKILLVCLIVGIIVLFRFRSKKRNNKVLRRFPGA